MSMIVKPEPVVTDAWLINYSDSNADLPKKVRIKITEKRITVLHSDSEERWERDALDRVFFTRYEEALAVVLDRAERNVMRADEALVDARVTVRKRREAMEMLRSER